MPQTGMACTLYIRLQERWFTSEIPFGKRGLYQRLTNHLHGASSFTIKYLNRKPAKLRNSFTYQFIEIDQPRLRALLQAYAIGVLCPAHIGEGVVKKVGAKRD